MSIIDRIIPCAPIANVCWYGILLATMALNANIVKKEKENSLGVLKRFSQKVRGAGVVQKLKSKKFEERKKSAHFVKEKALRRIERRSEAQLAYKLGKKVKR